MSATSPGLSVASHRRWYFLGAVVAVLLLGLLSLCTWALPMVLRLLLEHQGTAVLGRQVSVAQINWQPTQLVLDIDELQIAGSKAQDPPALRLQHLRLDLSWQSLRQRAWIVDGFTLAGLHLRIQHQGNGHYDWDEVLQALQQPPTSPDAARTWPPMVLSHVQVQNAALDFVDQPQGLVHEIRDFNLKIPQLNPQENTRQARSDWELHFKLNGDAIDWHSHLQAWSQHPSGDLQSHSAGLDLSPYLPYWPKQLGWQPLRAHLAWDLTLHWPANSAQGVTLKGQVALLDTAWAFQASDSAIPEAQLSWQRLQWDGDVQWSAPAAEHINWLAPVFSHSQLQSDGLQWQVAGQPLVSWSHLALSDVALSVPDKQISVGYINWQAPQVVLQRDPDGHWSMEKWGSFFSVSTPTASAAQGADAPQSSTTAAPWTWQWQAFQVQDGMVAVEDQAVVVPLQLKAENLHIKVGPWSTADLAAHTALAAQIETQLNWGKHGSSRFQYQGLAQAEPFGLRGTLAIEQLPLHLLTPYGSQGLPFALRRAEASWHGRLDFMPVADSWRLQLLGDAQLENVQTHTLPPAEPLLQWRLLDLQGILLDWQEGQLSRLRVAKTTLEDYEARVSLAEDGRLNLQTLWSQPVQTVSTPATTALVTPTVRVANPPIDIGPVWLKGGQVDFIDHFIRPNYALHLTDLSGKLEAFSNQTTDSQPIPVPARVHLWGKAQESAALDLTGEFNPFGVVTALDVRGQVDQLQLPSLSPYSIKYVGQGIESGQLTLQVHYQIDAQGQLQANNQLILKELQFGERDEHSPAPNLPLRLAVALLADAQGVIHVNLPVRGSLNDPDFRLGDIVWELVKGLVSKAITAPFSLLAHWLGNSAQAWQAVDFVPGLLTLSADSQHKLQQLAHTLLERPNLQLQLTGHAHTGETDLAQARAQAVRQALLQQGVAAERIQIQNPSLHETDTNPAEAEKVSLNLHSP